jgi:hypothetical protein
MHRGSLYMTDELARRQAKEQADYEKRLAFRKPRIHARGVPIPDAQRPKPRAVVLHEPTITLTERGQNDAQLTT